ncbi:hypothetical protein [Clostridium sp. Marseille-P2415]|uniref:hypothetical protein n=1 Tax=Clostridium sp. Marseille-P2415 TaxID=1805471 RepID=UPI00111574F4|nr:hypothetical protein [Clostridium sp. Marseille-P2415]
MGRDVMGEIIHFLYLIYKGFKRPLYYCTAVSIALVVYLNFCLTQYKNLEHRLKVLEEVNYSNIYKVTFVKPKDNDYVKIIKELDSKLKENAAVLDFTRNPLYTTIKKKHIVKIRTVSREEASLFHIFENRDINGDGYSAIISNDLKSKFKSGQNYTIPVGMYVNGVDQKVKINVSGYSNNLLIFSGGNFLEEPDNQILVYDPDNTLPVHTTSFFEPTFNVFLYIENYEEVLNILSGYDYINIQKIQDSVDSFSDFKLTLLPSYFRFLILGIVIYILLYVNLYILFYFKKKNYIKTFSICNLNRKFYMKCIGTANVIQLFVGFIVGQTIWILYCKFGQTFYTQNGLYIFITLFMIHFCAFIILSRGYSYIVRASH